MCSTVSTAYVHGGRPGVLPETAVAAAAPPSLWHPLEPAQQDGKAPGHAVTITANGSLANGNGEHHPTGTAKPEGRRASVPGVYLDLETELVHAQASAQGFTLAAGHADQSHWTYTRASTWPHAYQPGSGFNSLPCGGG